VSALFAASGAPGLTDSYLLGPGDRISVSAGDLKELDFKPATVDADGTVDFQYTGPLKASGMTCAQLAAEIERKLLPIVREPVVRVEVVEYGSQPRFDRRLSQ
jgi:protein involved in polysaccharide export with SLBB domain